MTRTFVAIELRAEARAALQRTIERLREALPGIRFVEPASLHLTLAFLGELNDARLAAAIEAMEKAAMEAGPFTLQLAEIGIFGALPAPTVIWAGVSGDVPALLALQSRLMAALEVQGFVREKRPFAPHLTLARLKYPLEADAAQRLAALLRDSHASPAGAESPLPIDALAVMKSDLSPKGACYTRLRECRLAGR